jgi:hypothetical protein
MPNVNPGVASTVTPNTQAVMGLPGATSSSGTSGLYNAPLSATLSGTVNNWNPPGWVPGVTNLLSVTPSSTPILTGINTSGMGNGFTFLLYNASTTVTLQVNNLSASSLTANQFACPGAGAAFLGPQTATPVTFNGTNLIFSG